MTDRPFDPGTVLVTGGSGFIGSTLVRRLLAGSPARQVVNLDALTYAASPATLADVAAAHGAGGDGRYHFVHGDVRDRGLVERVLAGRVERAASGRRVPAPDAVLHLAAASHVDRAILDPAAVVDVNVNGTLVLLDAVRIELAARPREFRYVQVSTDEVYGALDDGAPPVGEEAPLAPNNPYAAGKAAGDLLVRAYARTFGVPALITRGANTFGPYQFPEKLIPLFVVRALRGEPLPVFGDGLQRRRWLSAEDHAAGIWAVCARGDPARLTYNLGGDAEHTTLEIARRIVALLGTSDGLIRLVPDRPAHDRRYAVDDRWARRELGWAPSRPFDAALADTVRWYVEHAEWWEPLRGEAYRATEALYLARGMR